jgi:hypothetical protein
MMLPLVSSMSFPLQQSRTQFLQWIGMLSISGGDITLEDDASISAICQNGALVPEVAVPGAYNQVCMNLPERILKIDTNSQQVIRIQQQTSGSGKTGLAVWNSGLVLMRLLVAFNRTRCHTRLEESTSSGTGMWNGSCQHRCESIGQQLGTGDGWES